MTDQNGNVAEPVAPESETSKRVAVLKVWLPKLVPVVFTVLAAITANRTADLSAKGKADLAKDKAEAGYQGVDKWVTHFEETDSVLLQRIAKVEAELTEMRRKAKLSVTKRKAEAAVRPPPPAPAAVPTPPPPPPPLAPTLDKALEQIQAQQKAPEAPPAPPK